jgi:hypothetical protein
MSPKVIRAIPTLQRYRRARVWTIRSRQYSPAPPHGETLRWIEDIVDRGRTMHRPVVADDVERTSGQSVEEVPPCPDSGLAVGV